MRIATPSRHVRRGPAGRYALGQVRSGLCAVAGAVLLALAACGGDSADPASVGGGPGSGEFGDEPTIKVTFDISGDVTMKTSITSILPAHRDGTKSPTCEDWAKGYSPSDGRMVLDLPNFVSAGEVEGHRFVFDGRVSKYKGPGTYPLTELSGTGNPIGFSIDGHSLVAKEGGDVTVTVNADGSGNFGFKELTETSTGIQNPQSITGGFSWTCQNP